MREIGVALIDPKYPHNVGQVLRLCACYDVPKLVISGRRVALEGDGKRYRLPREERLKSYSSVDLSQHDKPTRLFGDATPVAVEFGQSSECLIEFQHPNNAVYVFGPEDGSLDRRILGACHRFVHIPTRHCLNLSTAVATVLYDRRIKETTVYGAVREAAERLSTEDTGR